MIISNKISRTLSGPIVFLGFTFVIVFIGFAINMEWIPAIVNFIIASYLIFSNSGIDINSKTREYRKYNKHFGLFKSGKWKSLDEFVGLTLIPMNKVYRMYSMTNRQSRSSEKSYQIFLVNKFKKPAFPIKICTTPMDAQNSIDEFAIWLKKPVYSVKRDLRTH